MLTYLLVFLTEVQYVRNNEWQNLKHFIITRIRYYYNCVYLKNASKNK